jgi:hypothetical protein
VPHSTLGPLHVVFRNRPATASDLGHAPDALFPEWVTEGLIARGPELRFAYSQAHFEAAREAVMAKLRQYEQAAAWGEADALCNMKLHLTADASPKMQLTGVHGTNGSARAYYADVLNGWKADAQRARSDLAGSSHGSPPTWAARLRHALPEQEPKRALVFAAVGTVALGGVLVWRHWQHRQGREERSTGAERV